jgi:hypothetical protein
MRAALALALIGIGALATLAPSLPARELYPGQYTGPAAPRENARSRNGPRCRMMSSFASRTATAPRCCGGDGTSSVGR